MRIQQATIKKLVALISTCALAITLTACGGGASGGDAAVTMNLGHVFPEGSEIDEAADAFAKSVEEKTDGSVKINVFPGGQIGSDEEMATALNAGTQEAAILSQGSSGFGDRAQLGNLPYLVGNSDEADQLFFGDGWIAEWDRETLKKNGIVGLEFVENGFRGLSNSKHKVETPDDVKGLKVRAPSSDLIIDIFSNWGGQAVAIPFPELYTALEQGTVDGQENGVTLFNDSKLYEVQDYYTDTRYTFATAVFSVAQSTWDKLSKEQQGILQSEAEAASLSQRTAVRASVETALDSLKSKIDVTVLTDDQIEDWRESVQPLYEKARGTYGAETMDELLAAVDDIRK